MTKHRKPCACGHEYARHLQLSEGEMIPGPCGICGETGCPKYHGRRRTKTRTILPPAGYTIAHHEPLTSSVVVSDAFLEFSMAVNRALDTMARTLGIRDGHWRRPASLATLSRLEPPIATEACDPVTVTKTKPSPSREMADAPKNEQAKRAILGALFTLGRADTKKLALVTGYAASGGCFRGAMAALKREQLVIDEGHEHRLSTEGHKFVHAQSGGLGANLPKLPHGPRALLDFWVSHRATTATMREILLAVASYGGSAGVVTIAEGLNYAAAGGAFRGAVSRLRRLGLLTRERTGMLTLTDELRTHAA